MLAESMVVGSWFMVALVLLPGLKDLPLKGRFPARRKNYTVETLVFNKKIVESVPAGRSAL
jgi:hypothetical protein